MKKKITAFLLILALLAGLAACGSKPAPAETANEPEPQQQTEQTKPSEPSVTKEPPAQPAQPTEPEGYQPFYTDAAPDIVETRKMLAGTWELVEKGFPIYMEPPGYFRFDEEGNAAYQLFYADETVGGHILLDNYMTEVDGACDMFTYEVDGLSEGLMEHYESMIGEMTDFLVIRAQEEGQELMALRFLGNGDTQFSWSILGFESETPDGFWMFLQQPDENELPVFPTDEEYDAMRVKDGTFYAFRWMDEGDRVYLQEVETEVYDEDWYGETMSCLKYTYKDNGHPLEAIPYKIEGYEEYAHSGEFRPGLVRVTTDASGVITDYADMMYLGYGIYADRVAEAWGDGGDYRDPEIFGYYDWVYIGEWIDPDETDSSLTIEEASVQTGGYYFSLKVKGLPDSDGYANLFEGDLHINQWLIDGHYLYGTIEQIEDDRVRLTITESEYDALPEGVSFEFVMPMG